jgi:hypothetical protein
MTPAVPVHHFHFAAQSVPLGYTLIQSILRATKSNTSGHDRNMLAVASDALGGAWHPV